MFRLDENDQHCSTIFLSAKHEKFTRHEEKEILNRGLIIKAGIYCVSDHYQVSKNIQAIHDDTMKYIGVLRDTARASKPTP